MRAACVVAVAHPRWGQRPVAFVDAADTDGSAIDRALRAAHPPHEVPDAILRMPPDEAGAMKSSRARLAARLSAGESTPMPAPGCGGPASVSAASFDGRQGATCEAVSVMP
ncbi:MAG: AMP-binding enzyme [Phycisphaerales bacterium]